MARELSIAHLSMYKPKGKLFVLFNTITADPELSFEIRIHDEVIVYYNKKAILTVIKGNKIKPLSEKYYKKGEGPTVDISNPAVWQSAKKIEKYLKEAKLIAYRHSMKREFQLQQNIAMGNHDCANRFLAIDMEWQFAQDIIKDEKDRIKKTRIDLVIVDLTPNALGVNDIYLTEVKLGTEALKGDSGLQGHVNSTSIIANSPYACQGLIDDVKSILAQKHELGIITGELPELHLAQKPKMLFILGHRGTQERKELEDEMYKLKIPTGLDEPIVMYQDTLIRL